MTLSQHAPCSSTAHPEFAQYEYGENKSDANISELIEMLGSISEFRKDKGKIYNLPFILATCVVAALSGAKNYREIATTVANIPQGMLRLMGAKWNYFTFRYEFPRKTTIWLALTSIDAGELDEASGKWLLSQARKNREDDGSFTWEFSMDGKVMRGAWTDENDQFTLFSAMLHREKITIAQVRVPDGTKENTQVQTLADKCDIREGETALVTLDAAHSGKKTGEIIGEKEGWDYLITLKTDKPKLYQKAKEKIAPKLLKPPSDVIEETKRGCMKIWSCWTADSKGINYPHLSQVACIRREVFDSAGVKISKDVAILMTSAKQERMTAAELNRHARNHWSIENQSHYIRDTVYREDDNTAYSGNGPNGLAALHNLAIGLLRLKGTKNVRETTELIHLDLTRAMHFMET
jgi:predicted transposase YbfD/YdcC